MKKNKFLPLVSVLSPFLIFSFIILCHTRGIFLMATMLLFCYFLYSSMRRSSHQKRPTRKAAGETTPDRGEPPRRRQRRDPDPAPVQQEIPAAPNGLPDGMLERIVAMVTE
jgi:hypothetical protein